MRKFLSLISIALLIFTLSACTPEIISEQLEVRVEENVIQWKLTDDETWNDLIDITDIEDLRGEDGQDGQDGQDGKEITLRVTETDIEWQYINDEEWTQLIPVSLLTGQDGQDGVTPHIGENGNWFTGTTDTGVQAIGMNGEDGEDGLTPYIGENGNWWIGDMDTEINAEGIDGVDGRTPHIGSNGHWLIGMIDTGVPAQGEDGLDGRNGQDGADGVDGADGADGADGVSVVDIYFDPYPWIGDDTATLAVYYDDIFEGPTFTVPAGSTNVYIEMRVKEDMDIDFDLGYYYLIDNSGITADWDETIVENGEIVEAVVDEEQDPIAHAAGLSIFYSGYGSDEEGGNPYGYEYYRIEGTTTEDMEFGVIYMDILEEDALDVEFNVWYDVDFDTFETLPYLIYGANVPFDDPYILIETFEPGDIEFSYTLYTGTGSELEFFGDMQTDYSFVLTNGSSSTVYADSNLFEDYIENYFDGEGILYGDYCGPECPGGESFHLEGIINETLYLYVVADNDNPTNPFEIVDDNSETATYYSEDEFSEPASISPDLIFELSDGSSIVLEMDIASGSEQLNELEEDIQNAILATGYQEMMRLQQEMRLALIEMSYNSQINNEDFMSMLMEEDDMMYIISLAMAMQYTYELEYVISNNYEQLFEIEELYEADLPLLLAFSDMMTKNENREFDLTMAMSFLGNIFEDILLINDIEVLEDSLYNTELFYGPGGKYPMPLLPILYYNNILSTYSQSSIHQYMSSNPLTDWDAFSRLDRSDFQLISAMNALGREIEVNYEPRVDLGVLFGLNAPGELWSTGGDLDDLDDDEHVGIFVADAFTFSYLGVEITFSMKYPTLDLNNYFHEFIEGPFQYTAVVPFGSSFPLPTGQYFYNTTHNSEDYYCFNDEGINRCFTLVGYEQEIEGDWETVSYQFGQGSEDTYWSFDGDYGDPLEDNTLQIYAVWDESLYEITFDYQDEDATPDDVNMISAGASITVPDSPTRDGFIFIGWFDAPVGGNAITGTFTPTEGMIIYAQWGPEA